MLIFCIDMGGRLLMRYRSRRTRLMCWRRICRRRGIRRIDSGCEARASSSRVKLTRSGERVGGRGPFQAALRPQKWLTESDGCAFSALDLFYSINSNALRSEVATPPSRSGMPVYSPPPPPFSSNLAFCRFRTSRSIKARMPTTSMKKAHIAIPRT
jgi:hypothetical protein